MRMTPAHARSTASAGSHFFSRMFFRAVAKSARALLSRTFAVCAESNSASQICLVENVPLSSGFIPALATRFATVVRLLPNSRAAASIVQRICFARFMVKPIFRKNYFSS